MWKQPYRDAFGKYAANPEHREVLTKWQDHWKETQGYITKRDQEYADYRKRFDPIGELVKPYESVWAQQGMTPDMGLRSVLSAYQALNQDPQGTLLRLAQSYGVDLQSAYAEAPYIPPEVQAIQQQLDQVNTYFQQQQQQQYQQNTARLNQEIQAFQTATDEKGNPLHPHFERVFDTMVQLAQAGMAKSIPEAYEKAVAWDKDLQAELHAQKQQEQAVTRAADAQRALEASKTVKSKGAEGAVPSKSFRDDMEAALAAAGLT